MPSCRLLHRLVSERLDVSLDVDVSLFETNIRLVGGLLSAHLFATDPALGLYPDPAHSRGDANDGAGSGEDVATNAAEDSRRDDLGRRDGGGDGDGYRGELLALAEDLGRRLLPAFETETGEDCSEYLQEWTCFFSFAFSFFCFVAGVCVCATLVTYIFAVTRLGSRQASKPSSLPFLY